MFNFLDVAVDPTPAVSGFEEATGISPLVFGLVIGVIAVVFIAVIVIDKKRR